MDELSDMQRFAAFVHPVGEIVELTVPTDPATLWGFGTWESYLPGRVLVGAGTAGSGTVYTAGQTGGEETHKLSLGELPTYWVQTALKDTSQNQSYYADAIESAEWTNQFRLTGWVASSGANGSFGNDEPHNNMQPYGVVYRWLRTA